MGSYAGQDSFGDKCLLRCVVEQIHETFGPDVRAVVDVQENRREAKRVVPEAEFSLAISHVCAHWVNRLRRPHVPVLLQMVLVCLTLPLWLVMTAANRSALSMAIQEVRTCSCLYFYGGTQLSEQWFTLNFPPLLLMLILCRVFGKPVYLGPQQYGPERPWQRVCLRWAVKWLVTDIRTRNPNCIQMLSLPEAKLCYDEVFSCAARYPIRPVHVRRRTFVLINMRASNFIQDTTDADFRAFASILRALYKRLRLPYNLFQMSGSSFCDDRRLKSFLDREGFDDLPVELVPQLDQEQDFIELAALAYGTVSMSFHGCVLSMIGGCPSVPVTSETYYGYKYVDFDRYTGGQNVPIVSLVGSNGKRAAESIAGYFERYQPARTAAAREIAASQINQWYHEIRDQSRNGPYSDGSEDLNQHEIIGHRN